MDRIASRDLRQLLADDNLVGLPHVSIYVPLGVTNDERERAKDKLARMVQRAETLLHRHYPALANPLVKPLKALGEKLPKLPAAKGLAVFCSPRRVAYVPLEERVGELAVVAESFHLKPLIPLAQDHEAFYLLWLEAGSVRLLHGGPDALVDHQSIDAARLKSRKWARRMPGRRGSSGSSDANVVPFLAASDLAAFYGEVDRVIRRLVGRKRTPVILVGSAQHVGLYRGSSRIRSLATLEIDTHRIKRNDLDALHRAAWPIASGMLARERRRLTRPYRLMRLRGKVVERLDEIARAAFDDKIATLFLEAGVHVWGHCRNGSLHLQRSQDEAASDDILDDLAERVLSSGGKVYVLTRSEMPGRSPAVAILR